MGFSLETMNYPNHYHFHLFTLHSNVKTTKDSSTAGIKLHYLYPESCYEAIQGILSFQMSHPHLLEGSPYPPLALYVEVERQSFTELEPAAMCVNHLHTMLLHTRTHFGGFTRPVTTL